MGEATSTSAEVNAVVASLVDAAIDAAVEELQYEAADQNPGTAMYVSLQFNFPFLLHRGTSW